MADIELVIKIPEEVKNRLCFGVTYTKDIQVVCEALNNSTPLPTGHGRLKDMGNLQYVFDLTREDPLYSGKDIERAIKSMTTIIGADTESEDYE